MENEGVLINKYEIIERCINRINEEYENNPQNLDDYRKVDAIVLNLQRACEACCDIASYVVSSRKLGIPQIKRDAFILLEKNKLIDSNTCTKMKNMITFRNIAVHDYKQIDEDILQDVIENDLIDLKEFARMMINLDRNL